MISPSLTLSFLLACFLSVSLCSSQKNGPVSTASFLLCGDSLTNFLSLELGHSVGCEVFCRSAKQLATECQQSSFQYYVAEHKDSAAQHSLHDSPVARNLSGTLSGFSQGADKCSMLFTYSAPPSGLSEEIIVLLDDSTIRYPIGNSPYFVTLLPESSPNTPFFSFSNQMFVVLFVIALCVFVAISIVLMHTYWEKLQKRQSPTNSTNEPDYAAFYEDEEQQGIQGQY